MRKLVLAFIGIVGIGTLAWQFTGLRRSEEDIRTSILGLTPLGTDSSAVIAVVQNKGWRTDGYANVGFYRQFPKRELVGKSSIRASLGNYHGLPYLIFSTNVTAFWGFDENRRLIDVWVWKTTDAL
jgi:hypothetical protein